VRFVVSTQHMAMAMEVSVTSPMMGTSTGVAPDFARKSVHVCDANLWVGQFKQREGECAYACEFEA
jgi:hypothetical protein